jgi:hypothetical protein
LTLTSYSQAGDWIIGSATQSGVIRDDDGAFIPNDPDNVDWQAYQAWLDEGNAANPTPPIPINQAAQLAARTEFRARKLESQGQYLEAYALRQGLPPPPSTGA